MSSALAEVKEVAMKELVIDRTRWYRGRGSVESRLCRAADKMMCCLGFYALSCSMKESNIIGVTFPSSIEEENAEDAGVVHESTDLPEEMDWLLKFYTPSSNSIFDTETFERKIGEVNDDVHLDEPTRESLLTELFATQNIKVTFIN